MTRCQGADCVFLRNNDVSVVVFVSLGLGRYHGHGRQSFRNKNKDHLLAAILKTLYHVHRFFFHPHSKSLTIQCRSMFSFLSVTRDWKRMESRIHCYCRITVVLLNHTGFFFSFLYLALFCFHNRVKTSLYC